MVAPYPSLDERRAKEFLAQLQRMAATFLPAWRGATEHGDAGHALVQIAARLAAQVTHRLDAVPRRDAVAFFDALDIPPQAPQPAQAPLVFTLAEKRESPVYAPARIQVAASADGEEILFETLQELRLTPARLSYLAAVDTDSDRIEEAPPGFLDVVPPEPAQHYQVATFADAGSEVLQITPDIGLDENDSIRIQDRVYRLEKGEDGLFPLADPLEAAVAARTEIEKVTSFTAFDLRNLQEHVLYIGHAELLNLEQPATLRLVFSPPEVLRRLLSLGLQIDLFGTDSREKEPRWHPVGLVGAKGGELELLKDWKGSVDEYKVHGHKSRWLRARLSTPLAGRVSPGSRINRLTLGVASGAKACGNTECKEEGSQTLSQALHNGTPLPLTTRFYPFGSEPRRFDTFALAAPEALSKKGAKLRLQVDLVDASVESMAIPLGGSDAPYIYAIGGKGRLQLFTPPVQDTVEHWYEFKDLPPTQADLGEDTARPFLLDGSYPPQALLLDSTTVEDLVVVRDSADSGGRLWSVRISKSAEPDGFKQAERELLPPLPGNATLNDHLLFGFGASSSLFPYLLAVANEGLYLLWLGAGVSERKWYSLHTWKSTQVSTDTPQGGTFLVPLLTTEWPEPSETLQSPLRFVLLDGAGVLWQGRFPGAIDTIDWTKLEAKDEHGDPIVTEADDKVRPVAAYLSKDDENALVVYAAYKETRKLFALIGSVDALDLRSQESFECSESSSLLCLPGYLDFGSDQPLAVAFGADSIALWSHADRLLPLARPTDSRSSGILIPQNGSRPAPILVLCGRGEKLFHANLTSPDATRFDFELHDAVILSGSDSGHHVELVTGGPEGQFLDLTANPAIKEGDGTDAIRVYALDQDQLVDVEQYIIYRHRSLPGGLTEYSGTRMFALLLDDGEDPGDRTSVGDSLLIENGIYEVSSVSTEVVGGGDRRIAELKFGLSSGYSSVFYLRLEEVYRGERVAEAADKLSLPEGDQPDGLNAGETYLFIEGGLYQVSGIDPPDTDGSVARTLTLTPNLPPNGTQLRYLPLVESYTGAWIVQGTQLALDPDDERISDIGNCLFAEDKLYRVSAIEEPEPGETDPWVATLEEVATLTPGLLSDDPESVTYLPFVKGFTGTRFLETHRLRLDSRDEIGGDKGTRAGDRLYIQGQLFKVEGIEAKIASLVTALPDTGPQNIVDYVSWFVLAGPQAVDAGHRSTLLKSSNLSGIPPSQTRLRFEDPSARPLLQAVRLAGNSSGVPNDVWILLEQGWEQPPVEPLSAQLPGAEVAVGSWGATRYPRDYQNPELSWEYFDGNGWRRLDRDFSDTTGHFAATGEIEFRVPDDIQPTDLAGQTDYWIRARLVGGDYGRAQYIVTSEEKDDTTTQTVTVDTSGLNPPEIRCIDACYELCHTEPPTFVLTENNRAVLDQTQANRVSGAEFELFSGALAIDREVQGRALYLGFSKPFNLPTLTLWVDAEEQPREIELSFEVKTSATTWQRVTADDETQGLHHRGFIRLAVDAKPIRAALFGREQFWMRIRPRRSERDWSPHLKGVFVNAGLAVQAASFRQEILGSSIGDPDQRYFLSQTPVLPESVQIRVRESLSEEEQQALEAEKSQLPRVATYPSIPGLWVRWDRVDSFLGADADSRVYRLDPDSGELQFGNGAQGRIPPAGRDAIRAVGYQSGGGAKGNVPGFAIEGLKSSVESVEQVANPIAAAGGVDAPSVDALIATAPSRLRHNQQALTAPDFEALALAWSPNIVRARCLTPSVAERRITLVIAMRTGERCPQPSLVDRDALKHHLLAHAWGGLAEDAIEVIGPTYVQLSVEVKILAVSSKEVSAVEKVARERLQLLLHPIDGGPDGKGWPFGRPLWESDILRALAGIQGLDRIIRVDPDPASPVLSPTSLICGDPQVQVTFRGEGV